MAVTGFRARIVALTVLVATAVVAVLVVVSDVLLSRVTDADARDLAKTRAEAVAANVVLVGDRVVLGENGSEALDQVAWVYADGRLIDGQVPSGAVERVEALVGSGRSQQAVLGHYLLYAHAVPLDRHRVMVVVRVDLMPYETSEQHSLTLSLVLGALAVLLATTGDTTKPGGASISASPATSWGNWDARWAACSTGSTTRWPTNAGSPTRSPTSCGRRSRPSRPRRNWHSCRASRWHPTRC